MARTDWAALLTDPAAEYRACTELQRFGLDPYLPQFRRRVRVRADKYVLRNYPLFPRYLLIPYRSAHDPSIRMARGISRVRPLLADDDGRPWRAPQHIVEGIRQAEQAGRFDEILHKGDEVTLTYGILSTIRSVITSEPATGIVELMTPLFGGARVKAKQSSLTK